MATGASGKDMSKGTDNQPGNSGAGSPRIQGSWSRKTNPSMGSTTKKKINP